MDNIHIYRPYRKGLEMLEKDWKIFRKRVPQWRERYLQDKNKEIVDLLTDKTKIPSEQFWDAKHKINQEAKILVRCLDGHSRSKMDMFLILMYNHDLINKDDLKEFSDELREKILRAVE